MFNRHPKSHRHQKPMGVSSFPTNGGQPCLPSCLFQPSCCPRRQSLQSCMLCTSSLLLSLELLAQSPLPGSPALHWEGNWLPVFHSALGFSPLPCPLPLSATLCYTGLLSCCSSSYIIVSLGLVHNSMRKKREPLVPSLMFHK